MASNPLDSALFGADGVAVKEGSAAGDAGGKEAVLDGAGASDRRVEATGAGWKEAAEAGAGGNEDADGETVELVPGALLGTLAAFAAAKSKSSSNAESNVNCDT